MENSLEGLHMIVGVIIFITAVSILMYMDNSLCKTYEQVLYKSIDSAIIYKE